MLKIMVIVVVWPASPVNIQDITANRAVRIARYTIIFTSDRFLFSDFIREVQPVRVYILSSLLDSFQRAKANPVIITDMTGTVQSSGHS